MASADPNDLIAARLFRLSIGVFFIGGFLSSLISLLVPRLTLLYGLDYARALLVQLAFHLSYLLFAVPIGMMIMRIGYMWSAAIGLTVMTLSCGLLLWSRGLHSYAILLFSLLALSAGITFLQIAANTVVTVVGRAGGAASRLNLLQAFNSVGTVAGPLIGAAFILGSPALADHVSTMDMAPPFLFAMAVLAALAIAFMLYRNLLDPISSAHSLGRGLDLRALLANRRLVAGTCAIFCYTGAEVAIGTLLVNYLVQPQVFGIDPVDGARLVSLYWGGAMIGRLAGAVAMRRSSPATLLMLAALGAASLALLAASLEGMGGGIALLAVGLCNSIMYPTIYVLALPDDPKLATPGATLLCMAVVGGAIIPLLTGLLADQAGLAASLALPAACYLGVAAFARRCRGIGF